MANGNDAVLCFPLVHPSFGWAIRRTTTTARKGSRENFASLSASMDAVLVLGPVEGNGLAGGNEEAIHLENLSALNPYFAMMCTAFDTWEFLFGTVMFTSFETI